NRTIRLRMGVRAAVRLRLSPRGARRMFPRTTQGKWLRSHAHLHLHAIRGQKFKKMLNKAVNS
ncbi:MAG: hypothetical protein J1F61_06810, partial [Clostridiales bacterium]|nr:hypothetical protein [Clostridiales bacterium]